VPIPLQEPHGQQESDLALISETSQCSVARWGFRETTPRRHAQVRLLELQTVIDLVRRVMHDDAARLWMRPPNPIATRASSIWSLPASTTAVIDLLLGLAEDATA